MHLKVVLKKTASRHKKKKNFCSATLSNCGKTLKLLYTKSDWKHSDGQGNDLGYGNSYKR